MPDQPTTGQPTTGPPTTGPRQRLARRLGQEDRVITASSGGADSALLATVAHQVLGRGALAVTAISASLPAAERAAARDFARARGLPHAELGTDELDRPQYVRNGFTFVTLDLAAPRGGSMNALLPLTVVRGTS